MKKVLVGLVVAASVVGGSAASATVAQEDATVTFCGNDHTCQLLY